MKKIYIFYLIVIMFIIFLLCVLVLTQCEISNKRDNVFEVPMYPLNANKSTTTSITSTTTTVIITATTATTTSTTAIATTTTVTTTTSTSGTTTTCWCPNPGKTILLVSAPTINSDCTDCSLYVLGNALELGSWKECEAKIGIYDSTLNVWKFYISGICTPTFSYTYLRKSSSTQKINFEDLSVDRNGTACGTHNDTVTVYETSMGGFNWRLCNP